MIYIFEQGNYVLDGNTLSAEEKANAIVVANKPVREDVEGKIAVLKWDVTTQTAWYEYEDIPQTENDLINTLGQELATLKIQLIRGGVI